VRKKVGTGSVQSVASAAATAPLWDCCLRAACGGLSAPLACERVRARTDRTRSGRVRAFGKFFSTEVSSMDVREFVKSVLADAKIHRSRYEFKQFSEDYAHVVINGDVSSAEFTVLKLD